MEVSQKKLKNSHDSMTQREHNKNTQKTAQNQWCLLDSLHHKIATPLGVNDLPEAAAAAAAAAAAGVGGAWKCRCGFSIFDESIQSRWDVGRWVEVKDSNSK